MATEERERPGRPSRALVLAVLGAGGASAGIVANAAMVLGAAALVGSGIVHLHLWLIGYRHIPTIGPLFLMQFVAGCALGFGIAALRRVWCALLGLAFAASTIAAFVWSLNGGLFGFQDSWSAPDATLAFVIEIVAVVALGFGIALAAARRLRPAHGGAAGAVPVDPAATRPGWVRPVAGPS